LTEEPDARRGLEWAWSRPHGFALIVLDLQLPGVERPFRSRQIADRYSPPFQQSSSPPATSASKGAPACMSTDGSKSHSDSKTFWNT
jgi:hypothetical protein